MKKNKKRGTALIIFQCLFLSVIVAQHEVKGKIISSEDKEPIPGVVVVVKNATAGTMTDHNGQYTINVPSQQSVLVFSQLGLATREVPVDGRQTINIEMSTEEKAMNEVVVIGYGTSLRKDLTGSVSSVSSDEIMKGRTSSVLESLQGKLPGVQVTSASGEPGGGVSITIRGGNSINAGTEPLYVIDGLQIDVNTSEFGSSLGGGSTFNPLSSLNASDIESIDVLKDASATAIYGSRGANGVIIITTKSGKRGALNVDFDAFGGVAFATKKIPVLQGQDYANYRFLKTPNSEWGIDTDGDGFVDQVKDFSDVYSHNWQDEILRPALTQSYNLSINGGSNVLKSSANIGYYRQEGIIDNNNFQRFNARFRTEADVNSKLTIGFNSNLAYTLNQGAAVTNGDNSYNGLIQSFLLFKPYNFVEDLSDTENYGMSKPTDFLNEAYKSVPLTRVMIDAFASYKFLEGLILRTSVSGGLTSSKTEEWYPSTTSWGYQPNGLAVVGEASSRQWQSSTTLTYMNTFAEKHYINVMIGFELSDYQWSSLNTRSEGFAIQTYNGAFDIGQANLHTVVATEKTGNTRLSQFGRFNYNYKDRYLLTTTFRRDGSSKFGINNKYALFPSAALAWKVHEESFMKNLSNLDELKLRASLGASGNDRIRSNITIASWDKAYYGNAAGDAELGLGPAELSNPNLKWETTYQYDAGVNIQLFKNRIGLDVDYYYKDTRDMLLRAEVASQIGSFNQWQNIGRVSNRGWEVAVSTTNIQTKDFLWTSSFNINTNKNRIESLGSVSSVPVNVVGGHITEVGRLIVGGSIGSGWGYVQEGVYQEEDFNADGSLKDGVVSIQGISSKPGDLKFKDLAGDDNIVDPVNDKTIISRSDPIHFGGFGNTFQYKDFDLSILFQWSYGNEVMNIGRYRYEGYVGYMNVSQDYWNNRWTTENKSNQYPGINGNGKTESSTYYVEDASYLRLKNIVLGYTLPTNVSSRIGVKNIRVYGTIDNLLTFTKYSGFDPEVSYWNKLISGLDNISYPRARTFTIGCSIKF